MTEELEKKVAQAIRLLKATAPKDGSPVEVAYSGGKDSDDIRVDAGDVAQGVENILRRKFRKSMEGGEV